MRTLNRLVLVAGLALGLLPATSMADTFRIIGQELTGETKAPAADGSVRTVVEAGVSGFLYHVEEREFVPAQALITMSITVNEDVLIGAEVRFTQLGPRGFTVTVQIDPCWFEYVNDRAATAEEFGDDVVARIEAQIPPGALPSPSIKAWLIQRVALLAAKTAEPYVKNGIILVPPRG